MLNPVPKPARSVKAPKQMRRSNPKRRKAMYARNFGERGAAIRAMPCLLQPAGDCRGRIEAAHARARGMGGVKGDRRELVPLCSHHHRVSGELAATDFAARYRVDLHAEAARLAVELDRRGFE